MICKALILGTRHCTNKPGAEKKFDFHVVNYVDTEDPTGASQEMSLDKNDDPTAFDRHRMKVVSVNIFKRDKYANFGGFVNAA